MLTSEKPEPHVELQHSSTTQPTSVLIQQTLTEQDTRRICEILARFSQYTLAFEQEEEGTHDNHP